MPFNVGTTMDIKVDDQTTNYTVIHAIQQKSMYFLKPTVGEGKLFLVETPPGTWRINGFGSPHAVTNIIS
jgi:hypothetical protein